MLGFEQKNLRGLGRAGIFEAAHGSQGTAEKTTMENLVPREVYDSDDTGYRQRIGLFTGLFFA
jgi:hypothetical protein